MFIFANLILAVASILKVLLEGYMWIVIISASITLGQSGPL